MSIKRYSELIRLPTFEERFEYLKIGGYVGDQTFYGQRYLNQRFYQSEEWHSIRSKIIMRDLGCDLADPFRPINSKIYIHHLNPITIDDLRNMSGRVTDPENLICCSFYTHQAIHYGNKDSLPIGPVERKLNDQSPWRN